MLLVAALGVCFKANAGKDCSKVKTAELFVRQERFGDLFGILL